MRLRWTTTISGSHEVRKLSSQIVSILWSGQLMGLPIRIVVITLLKKPFRALGVPWHDPAESAATFGERTWEIGFTANLSRRVTKLATSQLPLCCRVHGKLNNCSTERVLCACVIYFQRKIDLTLLAFIINPNHWISAWGPRSNLSTWGLTWQRSWMLQYWSLNALSCVIFLLLCMSQPKHQWATSKFNHGPSQVFVTSTHMLIVIVMGWLDFVASSIVVTAELRAVNIPQHVFCLYFALLLSRAMINLL